MGSDLIFKLYSDNRTVFTLQEIGMLADISDFNKLKQQIYYFVKRGKLMRLRRGIYTKENFNYEELACKIYVPSYISLEYVLQKSGVIFQYSSQITIVSYLSRTVNTENLSIRCRKIKNDILYNIQGIKRDETGINIADPERAFLDCLYLNNQMHLDSPGSLDADIINKLLPVYNSKQLANKILKYF